MTLQGQGPWISGLQDELQGQAPGSQAYRMSYRDRPLDLRPTGGATGTGSWNLGLQEELQG
jgi:hypothetical protein